LLQKQAVFPAFSLREVTFSQMRKIGILSASTLDCKGTYQRWSLSGLPVGFGRIVSLQPDTDIQNVLWNRNRIRISETFLLIILEFRLMENVAHCTIIHLLSSFRSIFSAIYVMTPSLSMVYSLYHSVISFPS